MASKLSIDQVALSGRRVLARVDFNVPIKEGRITNTQRIDEAVPSGMVFIPFCYAEAAANILTSPQLDPFGKIPEFKYCAAKVEKLAQTVAAE